MVTWVAGHADDGDGGDAGGGVMWVAVTQTKGLARQGRWADGERAGSVAEGRASG